MRALILAAACLLALPAAAAVAPLTPRAVVEAERAFASDGAALGVKKSFLAHMADDAIVFNTEAKSAKAFYESRPDGKGPLLEWWPVWAGIASSGDLGFTTGPYTVNGKPGAFYFTVWKKQADGTWKWIFDGGADADTTGAPARDSEPAYLDTARKPGRYPEGAASVLKSDEIILADIARKSVPDAYAQYIACDGRLYTEGLVPAIGCGQFGAALAKRPGRLTFSPLGMTVSAGGDLAFTYGAAAWDEGGTRWRGHYARVWQWRSGWKLVFDELVSDPLLPLKPA